MVTLADEVPGNVRTTAAHLALAHAVTEDAVRPLIRPSSE